MSSNMSGASRTILSALMVALIILLTPFYVLASSSPSKAKIYLKPVSDTYIQKTCSDCKMFNESELRVGMEALKVMDTSVFDRVAYKVVMRGPYSSILKFNLSEIPPGAEIKQARLWLYVKNPPEGTLSLLLYVLKQEFNETETTWIYRTSKAMWKTPGGYSEPEYVVKTRVTDSLSEGDSVGFLVTDYVKRVLSGEIKDYGVVIRPKTGKVSLSDFGSSDELRLYVDFYSKEGARRAQKTRYSPILYVEFIKPTATISLSKDELTLRRGERASLTASESGSFRGRVTLKYRVLEAPGLRVGPLKLNISSYNEEPGFSADIEILATAHAPPGTYVIEFYPNAPGYGPEVVDYGRANLKVVVEGPTETQTQQSSTRTHTVSQTQTRSTVTGTGQNTASPTIPSTTMTSKVTVTASSPATGTKVPTMTPAPIRTTTVIVRKERWESGVLLASIGLLLALLVVISAILIRRRP